MSCDIQEEINWLKDDIQACRKIMYDPEVDGYERTEYALRIIADKREIENLRRLAV